MGASEMSDGIEVTWCVSDGYAGGSRRPQHTEISRDDLAYCTSEEEVRELFEETIQEHFERRIEPDWEPSQLETVIEAWKEMANEGDRD